MKTFAQLLTEYTERTGISDAELARYLGVRRQTIFRWKEGLTKRPRDRQDVLRLADKLRLSPQERDELLLAAGFAPETPVTATTRTSEGDATAAPAPTTANPDPATGGSGTPWRWLLAGGVVLVIVLASLLIWEMRNSGQVDYTSSITLGPTAAPGETLILVGQFANYGGEKVGYNVAGRLAEALRDQFDSAGVKGVRVQPIPEVIADQAQAEKLGQAQQASLIIWGEYDSGRVLAHITPLRQDANQQEVRYLLDDMADLNTTINAAMPEEVRWLALVALGQTAYMNGDYDRAQTVFQQALQTHPPDAKGLDIVTFYLALLETRQPQPDLDQIIAYDTQAIDLAPGFVSALNNRSAAYLQRNAPGDVQRAVSDLRRVVAMLPDEASGHFNLGLALSRLGPDYLQEAVTELERAHALNPDSPGVNNALCWTYALMQQPETALPYCNRAVTLDPSGASHDSRGIVRAQLGDFEDAVTDFRYFLDHYQPPTPEAAEHYKSTREAWIQALQKGQNPFDAGTLSSLSSE